MSPMLGTRGRGYMSFTNPLCLRLFYLNFLAENIRLYAFLGFVDALHEWVNFSSFGLIASLKDFMWLTDYLELLRASVFSLGPLSVGTIKSHFSKNTLKSGMGGRSRL